MMLEHGVKSIHPPPLQACPAPPPRPQSRRATAAAEGASAAAEGASPAAAEREASAPAAAAGASSAAWEVDVASRRSTLLLAGGVQALLYAKTNSQFP